MINNIFKIFKSFFTLIVISFLIVSCGFTPTYKLSNNSLIIPTIMYEINEDNSYATRQMLSKNLLSTNINKAEYVVKILVDEIETAINIQSSGSVNKYRVETIVNFEIFTINAKEPFYKSKTRGFSKYDVSESEYSNKLLKENALKAALSEAVQLMGVIVGSKINQ